MRLTPRELLIAGAAAAAWPRLARAEGGAISPPLRAALDTSPVVYVCPLKRDGSESHCHAEVWFASDIDSALVVTNAKAWRARAIGLGLTRARLWVGAHGSWDPSLKTRPFEAAPTCLTQARLEPSQAAHDHALALFGSKYTSDWGSWGPKFKNGLADGTRVLIRYRPVSA